MTEQNFCHRDTFIRNSPIVFRTFQNVSKHQRLEIQNFHKTILSSIYIEESKEKAFVLKFDWAENVWDDCAKMIM